MSYFMLKDGRIPYLVPPGGVVLTLCGWPLDMELTQTTRIPRETLILPWLPIVAISTWYTSCYRMGPDRASRIFTGTTPRSHIHMQPVKDMGKLAREIGRAHV